MHCLISRCVLYCSKSSKLHKLQCNLQAVTCGSEAKAMNLKVLIDNESRAHRPLCTCVLSHVNKLQTVYVTFS